MLLTPAGTGVCLLWADSVAQNYYDDFADVYLYYLGRQPACISSGVGPVGAVARLTGWITRTVGLPRASR
eukprot:scaffold640406_cov11-Prasinocladus_malaysianus.AAC.1